MSRTAALSAPSAGAPLQATTIERRDLRHDDVRIDIEFAGICHSDIHQVREEWGRAQFPMVPGHEIAGVVSAVGDGVTRYKVGDRVGVGCMVDSCGQCAQCKDGHENFCEEHTVWTYNDVNLDGEPAMGGYSQQIVVSERFAVRIPDGLDLDVAAPLLCAGITVYTPAQALGRRPRHQGRGGRHGRTRAHGRQDRQRHGCRRDRPRQGMSKEADGRRFGAVDYRATADGSVFKDLRGQFDLIISTISASFDVDAYLGLLRPFGAFVSVGLPPEAQSVRFGSLATGDKVLAGSNIGGIALTQEMLDFCAQHGIGAEIEKISADQVNDAYDRVVGSDVRYRFVIDTSTIQAG